MKLISTQLLLVVTLILAAGNVNALNYTASTSGNYSNPATWLGGNIPPTQIGANDVIINSGVTVTMDRNVVLNSTFSLFQMKGTAKLISTTKNYLSVNAGNFTGDPTSEIDVDSVYIGTSAIIQFDGSITANILALKDAPLSSPVDITVNQRLRLMGLLSQFASGTLTLTPGTPNPAIIFESGDLNVGVGATFTLSTPYNIVYQDAARNIGSGWELQGSGYKDIEIAIGSSNTTSLNANLTVNGDLKLTSGTLALNGYDLSMGANSTLNTGGTGVISSTSGSGSDITFLSTAPNIGTIRFDATNHTIDNFAMNTNPGNGTLTLGTDLSISGQLGLQGGKIDLMGNDITIASSGSMNGGSSNSYVITGQGGQVKQDIGANASISYQVGHTNAYTPIMIESKNGSTYTEMAVNVTEGVKAHATTGTDLATSQPLVNATWTIENASAATVDCSITAMWETAAEINGFDRTKSFVTFHENNDWDKFTSPSAANTNGNVHSQKRDGVNSLGSFAVFDENTVGIENIITDRMMHLYPNPAKTTLSIAVQTSAIVTVSNASGQIVNVSKINTNQNTIDVSALPQGMYFIHLEGEAINSTGKFMKE